MSELIYEEALNFIIENPDYIVPLTIARIEDIHSFLIKDLQVERSIRQRRIGISGTNYKPLDNEHQIREVLDGMCRLINRKENVFEESPPGTGAAILFQASLSIFICLNSG